jgi:hypothetical protein
MSSSVRTGIGWVEGCANDPLESNTHTIEGEDSAEKGEAFFDPETAVL